IVTWSVVLRPEAEADLLSARDCYEQQRPGIGKVFAGAVDELISRLEATPRMYAVALLGVRRAKLRTFPYLVYYRVLSDRVEVIAILHGHRDPRTWQGRV